MSVDRRLRVEINGGTIADAVAAGMRAPANARPDGVVMGFKDLVLGAIAGLDERIAALEERAIPAWRGIWAADQEYGRHDIVTYSGSMWIAVVDTPTEKPSLEGTQWNLVVKRGRDARTK